MQPVKNNMATASMVMGILSLVLSCCCFLGIIFASLGLIFGCLSKVDETFAGTAKAGLITSVIGIILSVIFMIFWIFLIGSDGFDLARAGMEFRALVSGGAL